MLSPGKPAYLMPTPRRGEPGLTDTPPSRPDARMPRTTGSSDHARDAVPAPKHNGYGLPCMNCRTYYPADLSCCPVCQTAQRPLAPQASEAESGNGLSAELQAIEVERERFLQEFRLRFVEPEPAAEAEQSAAPAGQVVESSACSLQENHDGCSGPACICQDCYRRLLARIDVIEAALHMDAREAAQIVYEAVWTDPSDPSRTYENAARALLGEIRKRAGVAAVLGSLRPFTH
jgi:hypothetical protein